MGLVVLASPEWIALMAYGMENIGKKGFDFLAAGNTVGYLPIPLSHMFAACWIANAFHCHCMKMNIACAVNFGYKAPTDFQIFRGSKRHCLMAKL